MILSLSGLIDSTSALLLGFLFSLLFINPYPKETKKMTGKLLKVAIIGLGFGIFFKDAISANVNNLGVLSVSVILTILLGLGLTAVMGIRRPLGFLIASGTAVCGGSAIAAISPVIRADEKNVSAALTIVFALNSVALLIFPPLGKLLGLTQSQFGLWSAVAIHDTSSVVGAAMSYGDEALKIATTLKLSRTLWIIPVALFAAFWFKSKGEKITIPYFIGGFVLAIAINSSGVLPEYIISFIFLISKRLLVSALFLIGANLSINDLKTIGFKPILFAVTLWVAISVGSLLYIFYV